MEYLDKLMNEIKDSNELIKIVNPELTDKQIKENKKRVQELLERVPKLSIKELKEMGH